MKNKIKKTKKPFKFSKKHMAYINDLSKLEGEKMDTVYLEDHLSLKSPRKKRA